MRDIRYRGKEGNPLRKQKIVDILGILIPCGILSLVFWVEGVQSRGKEHILLGFEGLLLGLSAVRILLFRSIPKGERRRYDMRLLQAPGLFGRDVLVYPYTQGILVLLVFLGTLGLI